MSECTSPCKKTIPIQIPNNNQKDTRYYSLKQNLFDPSKNSPPNDFILKLQHRMNTYNSFIVSNN